MKYLLTFLSQTDKSHFIGLNTPMNRPSGPRLSSVWDQNSENYLQDRSVFFGDQFNEQRNLTSENIKNIDNSIDTKNALSNSGAESYRASYKSLIKEVATIDVATDLPKGKEMLLAFAGMRLEHMFRTAYPERYTGEDCETPERTQELNDRVQNSLYALKAAYPEVIWDASLGQVTEEFKDWLRLLATYSNLREITDANEVEGVPKGAKNVGMFTQEVDKQKPDFYGVFDVDAFWGQEGPIISDTVKDAGVINQWLADNGYEFNPVRLGRTEEDSPMAVDISITDEYGNSTDLARIHRGIVSIQPIYARVGGNRQVVGLITVDGDGDMCTYYTAGRLNYVHMDKEGPEKTIRPQETVVADMPTITTEVNNGALEKKFEGNQKTAEVVSFVPLKRAVRQKVDKVIQPDLGLNVHEKFGHQVFTLEDKKAVEDTVEVLKKGKTNRVSMEDVNRIYHFSGPGEDAIITDAKKLLTEKLGQHASYAAHMTANKQDRKAVDAFFYEAIKELQERKPADFGIEDAETPFVKGIKNGSVKNRWNKTTEAWEKLDKMVDWKAMNEAGEGDLSKINELVDGPKTKKSSGLFGRRRRSHNNKAAAKMLDQVMPNNLFTRTIRGVKNTKLNTALLQLEKASAKFYTGMLEKVLLAPDFYKGNAAAEVNKLAGTIQPFNTEVKDIFKRIAAFDNLNQDQQLVVKLYEYFSEAALLPRLTDLPAPVNNEWFKWNRKRPKFAKIQQYFQGATP